MKISKEEMRAIWGGIKHPDPEIQSLLEQLRDKDVYPVLALQVKSWDEDGTIHQNKVRIFSTSDEVNTAKFIINAVESIPGVYEVAAALSSEECDGNCESCDKNHEHNGSSSIN